MSDDERDVDIDSDDGGSGGKGWEEHLLQHIFI